jgi:hypothetical protein
LADTLAGVCSSGLTIDSNIILSLGRSNKAVIVERWRKRRPIVSFDAVDIYQDSSILAIEVVESPSDAVISQIVSALELNTVIHTLYLDYKYVIPKSVDAMLNCVFGSLRRLSVRVHGPRLFVVISNAGLLHLDELTLSHGAYSDSVMPLLSFMLKTLTNLIHLVFYDPRKGITLVSELPGILADLNCNVESLKLLHVRCPSLTGKRSWYHLRNLCSRVERLKLLHWEVVSSEYTPFIHMSDVLYQSNLKHLLIRAQVSAELAKQVTDIVFKYPMAVTLIGLKEGEQQSLLQEIRLLGPHPRVTAIGLLCAW